MGRKWSTSYKKCSQRGIEVHIQANEILSWGIWVGINNYSNISLIGNQILNARKEGLFKSHLCYEMSKNKKIRDTSVAIAVI